MPGERELLIRAHVPGEVPGRPRLEIELELGTGITAVMGPSGAGKSTLLFAIAGLLQPSSGRIELARGVLFDSELGITVPPHQRRVALVFQSLALFPHLRAWENVAYGLAGLPRGERRQRALGWLARARVGHVAERLPASLSGGEAQRVALARALASEPRALLLDEPFSAMDAALRADLGTELQRLVAEVNIPTILVTHDLRDAQRLGARTVELDAGRLAKLQPAPPARATRP